MESLNRETSITRPTQDGRPGSPDIPNSSEIAGKPPVTTSQTLEGMQRARDRIAAQRDDLNEQLATIDAAMQFVRQAGDTVAPTLNTSERRARVTDTIEAILREKRPQHRADILSRLEDDGVYVRGSRPLNSLSAYLSQDDRFVPVGNGEWSLVVEPDADVPSVPQEEPDS